MLRRVFKAFQYRDFRLMWAGACTSTIGTFMQTVAQAWVVLQISGSARLLGLDAFLANIPVFLFSLVGGVIADRVSRRHLLLASQWVQLTCAFTLAALYAVGVVRIWHILMLSFIVGTAQSFGGPAYSAIIPALVEKDDLPNAIALNSIQFNLARVIGPVLGGFALTYLGRHVVLFAEWRFLHRRDYLADDGPIEIRTPVQQGNDSEQHEAGVRFYPQARCYGRAHCPRVLHDCVRLPAAYFSSCVRQGRISPGAHDLYTHAGVFRARVCGRRSHRGGAG